MIAVINYGSGNIEAICTIYKRLNVAYCIASSADTVRSADRILLPGVGAFDQAMNELERSGLRAALDLAVLEDRKPVLGICVGMQLLARSSEEGVAVGLGWVPGTVRKFDCSRFEQATRLPHMGWNSVEPMRSSPLFAGVDAAEFYFLHSYHFVCDSLQDQLAVTNYGGQFTSAVNRGNVYGVQFHPEKSHNAGVTILRNFASTPVL